MAKTGMLSTFVNTASYNGITINNDVINKQITKYMKNVGVKMRTYGMALYRMFIKETTISFFRQFNSPFYGNMLNATTFKYHQNFSHFEGKMEYRFTSWVDETKYDIASSNLYQKWKHGKYEDLPSEYGNVFKYIVDNLQYKQGIMGLPEKSSRTDWVNSDFKQGKSLQEMLYEKFNSGQFSSAIMRKINR